MSNGDMESFVDQIIEHPQALPTKDAVAVAQYARGLRAQIAFTEREREKSVNQTEALLNKCRELATKGILDECPWCEVNWDEEHNSEVCPLGNNPQWRGVE